MSPGHANNSPTLMYGIEYEVGDTSVLGARLAGGSVYGVLSDWLLCMIPRGNSCGSAASLKVQEHIFKFSLLLSKKKDS